MPDITMCANKACGKRKNCYRFTATPDAKYQSYANFDGGDCFVPVAEKKVEEERWWPRYLNIGSGI